MSPLLKRRDYCMEMFSFFILILKEEAYIVVVFFFHNKWSTSMSLVPFSVMTTCLSHCSVHHDVAFFRNRLGMHSLQSTAESCFWDGWLIHGTPVGIASNFLNGVNPLHEAICEIWSSGEISGIDDFQPSCCNHSSFKRVFMISQMSAISLGIIKWNCILSLN